MEQLGLGRFRSEENGVRQTNGPPAQVQKNTAEGGERYSADDYAEYDEPITAADVVALREIGKKSINDFTSEDLHKAQKWAYKYYQLFKTKSPFFRSWFGDWRSMDTGNINIVKANKVQKLINGRETNADTEMVLSWNAHDFSRETVIHAARDKVSIEAIDHLPEIIREAILLDTRVSMPTSKSKMQNTAFMHSFYTVYENGDGTYLLKLYAEEALNNKGTNSFTRAYQLKDIKNIAALGYGVLGGNAPLSGANTATINTVADLFAAVKQYDPEFNPKDSSKVVNEDGTPKVMYHGTRAENGAFYVFDSTKAIKKGGLGLRAMGKGNYFTAKRLDGTERFGSRVIPAYLDIKNPFVYNGGKNFIDQAANALGLDPEIDYDTLQQKMRDRGYDGVIQYDSSGEVSIAVAFDSNQIKSATDNIGTFDGANPDIRYSVDELDDDAYLEAVQSGDLETAQRMVDEAAKAAGYTVRGFHGSSEKFNTFSYGHIGSATGVGILGEGFYFGDEKGLAKMYGTQMYDSYLRMENTYHAAENEQYKINTAKLAEQGYDSVDLVIGGGSGKIYCVFDNTQIKSADPVTYDDAGNVIPLSERFNQENQDIRYSVDELDEEEYARRQERGYEGKAPTQQEQQKPLVVCWCECSYRTFRNSASYQHYFRIEHIRI